MSAQEPIVVIVAEQPEDNEMEAVISSVEQQERSTP